MSATGIQYGPAAGFVPAVASEVALGVETITSGAAFAALRDEWTALLAASPSDSIFLTWEWLHTWWTHLSGDQRLALLAVRQGHELVAMAPFASRGTSLLGAPRLEFLGTGRVGSDYLDVIVRAGAQSDAVVGLAQHLVRAGATLDLRQVRITTSAAGRLTHALRRAGCRLRVTRSHRCPVIDLEGLSWEAYLAGLGAEHRYNFHRRLRKLVTQHDLRFELVTTEPRRRELLPVLFELHRLRWSGRGGSDGLEGAGTRAFHEELTRLALERGWLRLFVLWLHGAPAAAVYGFRYGRVFSFYQSGLDPSHHRLSVGLVALGLVIKSAIEEGAAEFDLLHGDEAYKFHWARRARRLGRVRVFPAGPLGQISAGTAAALGVLRGLARWWPGAEAALAAIRRGGRRAAPAR